MVSPDLKKRLERMDDEDRRGRPILLVMFLLALIATFAFLLLAKLTNLRGLPF